MSIKLYDLARMTTTTTGTGTITLGSAASLNGIPFLTFDAAGVQNGDVVRYGISDVNGREVGYGTYTTSSKALTRTVTSSTSAGAPINLSGAAQVFITPSAADLSLFNSAFQVSTVSGNTTLALANNSQQIAAMAALTISFPEISTLPLGWQVWIYAENGNVLLSPDATNAFAGSAVGATVVIPSGASVRVVRDEASTWVFSVTSSNKAAHTPGGYLTPVANTPFITSDASGVSSLYYTMDTSGFVPLYNGSTWIDFPVPSDMVLSLSPSVHLASTAYDIHVTMVGGTPTIVTSPAWRNAGNTAQMTAASNASPIVISAAGHGLQNGDSVFVSFVRGNTAANGWWTVASATAGTFALAGSTGNGVYVSGTGQFASRGNGASTAQITKSVGGIYTNAVAMTAYNGTTPYSVAVNNGTYVASIIIDSSAGQVTAHRSTGSSRMWGLWNFYNRKNISLVSSENTASWAYSSASWRPSNNSVGNRSTVFSGMPDDNISSIFVQNILYAAAQAYIGIGYGSTVINYGFNPRVFSDNSHAYASVSATHEEVSHLGVCSFTSLEYGNGTYYGTPSEMALTVSCRG